MQMGIAVRTASAAAALCFLAACGGGERAADAPCGGANAITATGAWIRAAEAGQPMSAAYVTLCNPGPEADALLAIESDVAEEIELHESLRDADGSVRMQPVAEIRLPPGAEVALAPGGMHVMLIGLAEPLPAGETRALTLTFRNAPAVTVEAEIRAAAAAAAHQH